jgi:hypothetical protein
MKKLILILTVIFVSFAFLSADVYIKTKIHTDAFEMMGQKQPAKDQMTEQWIGETQVAQVSEDNRMVVDLNKNVMYMIYPKTKTYVEAQLPIDMSKLLPPQAAQMASMMKMTVTVTPTGESKMVGKWNCKGYDINMNFTMMAMKMKAWATTDVPFDWQSYQDKLMPALMKIGGATMGFDENAINEFKKIKGMQVASEMTMSVMGQNMKTTTELLEMSKKPAPAGIYSVPAGYTKQEKLTMDKGM